MVKKSMFFPSEQDKVLFGAYVAVRHELVTSNGLVNTQELIDWMIQDLATELMRAGDRAYIRHACEAFGYTREHYYKHKIAVFSVQK